MANGNRTTWIKVASLTAIGGLIVVIITILSYGGSVVNEKIDNKIIAHERNTEVEHQAQIGKVRQDIAVLSERQERIREDIAEQKKITERNFEELKQLIKDNR